MTAPVVAPSRAPGGRRVPDPAACQRVAEQMLALARKAGADGAEVLVRDGTELEVKVRLGETELIKEAGSRALGLRVIKDQRVAVTYTSDLHSGRAGTTGARERRAGGAIRARSRGGAPGSRGDGTGIGRPRPLGRGDLGDGRHRRDSARAPRRGRGDETRQADHELRRGGVRPHHRGVRVRDVCRVLGERARHVRDVLGRTARGRRRGEEAQRIVLERQPLCGGARGPGVGRAGSGTPYGGQAGGAEVADRCRARRIFAGGWPLPPRSVRGRHVGRRRLAAEHLSRDPGGDRRRVASGRDRRRPPVAARAGLPPVRRRGAAESHQRARLRRDPAGLSLRRLRCAQARAVGRRVRRHA